jgi:dTDP-4-amino-4,6-dideoxygalactose transaminase
LADVEPQSWLLTPRIARAAIAVSRIDAVMPVSTYGAAQDTAAWDAFVRDTGIPVVIDAAGSFGNQRAGDLVTLVFSLHATKSLSAAEGGFVISGNAGLVARVRRMSNFGIDLATGLVDTPGTNAKLSEYHAAIGLAMLERWRERADRRKQLHAMYVDLLGAVCPSALLQNRPIDGVYSIMPVLLPPEVTASRVAIALEAQGIQTRRWYCPAIHHQPGFASAPKIDGLETVERLSERLLALPFHPFLSEADIRRVCKELAGALTSR